MLHNILKKEGNIKISGEHGTGKTTMLKLLLSHAIEFEDYDEIVVYASSREDYSEFLKEKKVKLGQFLKVSVLSTLFNTTQLTQLFPSSKKRLVIVDDFDAIAQENIYNGNAGQYRQQLEWNLYIKARKGEVSYYDRISILEKSDLELLREAFKKEITKYNGEKTKFCISNPYSLDYLALSFHQSINFSSLSSPLGQFELKTQYNLNDYLQSSKEDYWGDY